MTRSEWFHGSSRGQTNLDFSIGLIIFITFLSGTLFVGGSPLVDEDRGDVALNSNAELTLTQLEKNGLTDDSGEIDQAKIRNIIATDDIGPYINLSPNLNGSAVLRSPSGVSNPAVFDGHGDEIVIDGPLPDAEHYTATTTIFIDGEAVRVEMVVWREIP